MCAYLYTSQPPEDLVCNPYINQVMQLECKMIGANLGMIKWYFLPSNTMNHNNTIEIRSSSKYNIIILSSDKSMTAKLTIRRLTQENDSGIYWCQGILKDARISLTPSSSLNLGYRNDYDPTIPCIADIYLKSSLDKCVYFPEIVSQNEIFDQTTSQNTHYIDNAETKITLREMLTSSTTDSTPKQSLFFSDTLMFITIFTTLLMIVCIILAVIIAIQCKRRQRTDGKFNKQILNLVIYNKYIYISNIQKIRTFLYNTIHQHHSEFIR